MKSFFKKLAFVMAMAMVVSLAAPAAANAAEVLTAADQDTKEAVTVLALTVGEEEDLCFLGAPEGWRQLERGWKSSNTAVATVDDNGVIKAVAKGTATVEFYMEGCESAKVTVIVTEPKAVNEFELAQATEKAFTLTYANNVSYTLDDVQLFMVYENAADPANPIEIKWPINKTTSGVSGNVITVTPFVDFTDGQTYKIVVDGVEETCTVAIGAITDVVIAEVNGQQVVYANEEEEDNFYLKYEIQLFSNGVDLTNYYKNEVTIEWDVIFSNNDEADVEYAGENDEILKVFFWSKDVVASIQAKVTDEDDNVKKSNGLTAASIEQPAWKLVGVTDWVVLPVLEAGATPAKFDWNKSDDYKSVPADIDDASYIIVLKLVDSRGVEYVTDAVAANTDDDADLEIAVFADAEVIDDAGYEIKFYSADTDEILVDTDGTIGVYKETKAVYYVGLNSWNDDKDDYDEKYIWADELTVTEGRKLKSIAPGAATLEVVTATLPGYETLAVASTTVTAKDQYGNGWSNVKYAVDTDNDDVDNSGAVTIGETSGVLAVVGTKLASLNVSTVKVTVTATEPGTSNTATTTVTVTVKNPKANVALDTVAKTRYTEYSKITLDATDIDINAKDSSNGDMFATITLYKTSNGAIVGQYEKTDNILIATSADDLTTEAFTTEGARYIVVKKGNTYVTPEWSTDGKSLKVQFASADDDNEMVYGTTGTYTVEVVTVRYNTINTSKNNNYVVSDTIVVTNTTPGIAFDKKISDEYTATSIEDIVVETLSFTRGNAAWTITADMIVEGGVDTVEVGDYIIIKSVTFEVPVDGANVNGPHYTRTVYNINVSVKSK